MCIAPAPTAYDLHRALLLLDRAAFADAVLVLDRAGALAPYLKALPPALRLAFVEHAVELGVLDEIPALASDATTAAPPAAPRLIVNRRSLPRCLRLLVHEENIARTNVYADAYRAYLERYCALVERTETHAALRALGPPAEVFVPVTEPGLDFDGDDDLVWDFDRRVSRLDDSGITHCVHRRTFQFRHAA
jgi:hypothetical protein